MIPSLNLRRLTLWTPCLCAMVGCGALRGPEPLGPTRVSPPGPVVQGQIGGLAPSPFAGIVPRSRITLNVSGTPQSVLGDIVVYRIVIFNSMPTAARDVTITCPVPQGLTYLKSSPSGTASEQIVQWRLGELPVNGTATIQVSYRAEAAGVFNLCADLSTAGGALLRSCAITTVKPPAPNLQVSMTGPEKVRVGDEATFHITIANRGNAAATELLVTDTFDEGLVHAASESPIERDLADIEPGESQSFAVTFKVARAGRLCNRVVIAGDNGLSGSAEACVIGEANPAVTIRLTGPKTLAVGGKAIFEIEVKNTSDVVLTNLAVASRFDAPLKPTQATQLADQQVAVTKVGEHYELSPWRINQLQPGKTLRLQVECLGDAPSPRACGRVTVTSREGARHETTTCLAVTAVQSPVRSPLP